MTTLREWVDAHDTSEDAPILWSSQYGDGAPVYRQLSWCFTPAAWGLGVEVSRDFGAKPYPGNDDRFQPYGSWPDRRFITLSLGPLHLNYMSERRATK